MRDIQSIKDIEINSKWTDKHGTGIRITVKEVIENSVIFLCLGKIDELDFDLFIGNFWLLENITTVVLPKDRDKSGVLYFTGDYY